MLLQLLFIFLARIIDVSLGTVRMILVIKGNKYPAAIIGFFEILVYTIALGMVVGSLQEPLRLIVFCSGFALGILVGSVIEEKLSIGYRGIQVIIDLKNGYIVEELRNEGFPVTCWEASGRLGPKLVLSMVVTRSNASKLAARILEKDSEAFLLFLEPKQFSGGYIKKK
ncbi:MAG: DUF5698 domain-containing protein [Syntrophomonadaceae bacterium]|nr:DUF5698 domain-containing protein [Syntrophomonadaceae bacterium]MDD3023071.1 DUF5698 domain-containing protein [Syntrophomonadaceae bacterium]